MKYYIEQRTKHYIKIVIPIFAAWWSLTKWLRQSELCDFWKEHMSYPEKAIWSNNYWILLVQMQISNANAKIQKLKIKEWMYWKPLPKYNIPAPLTHRWLIELSHNSNFSFKV